MTVKVGIFWAIGGKVYQFIEMRATDKLSAREKLSGKIDSDFEHLTAWDKELSNKFPYADFATFPRGRVMFDIKENRHIIYADRCVTETELEIIKGLFDAFAPTVCRDAHYRCDTCMKNDYKIYYKILDGENKIGANLIEITCNDVTYLVECGEELQPTETGTRLREQIINKHYAACFITHYHGDHAGLLKGQINCDKIYMGEATFKILKAIDGICDENSQKVITFTREQIIELDGLSVTPFLCDHSAYDSYMLYFKSKKNSILYTGDFRSHGRKSYSSFLKRLPQKVNILICEGTNKDVDKPFLSEQELENTLVKICEGDTPVFVLQSATNIDRIVSVYRAAVRSNRLFIMRLVQADICSELQNIPQPNGFKNCFAYPEFPLTHEQHKKYTEKYGKRLIGRERISKLNKYILEITSKDLHYLQKLAASCNLQGAKLIYSTWCGYKEREDMKVFFDGVKSLGIEIIDLHASGHADKKTIKALRQRVNPDQFKQVHKPQEN